GSEGGHSPPPSSLAENRGQAPEVGAAVERFDHLAHGIDAVLGEDQPRAVAELLPELIHGQGMAGMARHGARAESDLAAVPQPKRAARPHVALELAGELRIHHHARALNPLPDGGILRLVVLERLHADLALA